MANPPGLRQETINQVHHFIENNLGEQLSIRELSDLNCLSYSAFRHLYQEATKEPIWHYVKRYRIEYAAGLLRHSNFSCVDIGELVGYASKHAFSKAFSDQLGISPTGFRSMPLLPADKAIAGQIDEAIFRDFSDFQKLEDQGSLRVENIIGKTYFYRREHAPSDARLFHLIGELFQQYPGRDVIVSTPDIGCVSGLESIRMNYGFIDGMNVQHKFFLSRQIRNQQYLVYRYHGPMHLIGAFVYKLIDIGKKTRQLSIRNHDCLIAISHKGEGVEIKVPV